MNENMTGLRGMLEQMTTAQLDEMLRCELEKEAVDENAVRLILEILRARDGDAPVEMNDRIEAAWKTYQSRTPVKEKPGSVLRSWPLRIAAVAALVLLLVLALPQNAEAEGFWGRLARWTDSIFEFFTPGDGGGEEEFVFQTDNPGLQQVYDTVTALGVTDPVVPMWLPEGFELTEFKVNETRSKTVVYSEFLSDANTVVIDIAIFDDVPQRKYNKDETTVGTHEIMGVEHNILHNNDWWTAVWEKEKLECTIYVDCQEETLYRILKSIYIMED